VSYLILVFVVAIASIVSIRIALAGSAPAPLAVSVTVVRSCSVSTTPIVHGNALKAILSPVCSRELNPAIRISGETGTTESSTMRGLPDIFLSPKSPALRQTRDEKIAPPESAARNLTITVNF
jgi:hypothetical protein